MDLLHQMLTRSEIRLAKNIQSWAIYEFNKNPNVDFELLTMDNYDAFLMTHAVQTTPQAFSAVLSPGTPIPTSQIGQNQGPTTPSMTTGFNPMVYMNPTTPMTQQSASSSFMNSVKCDIKQYPTFAGDFDKWPYFKRQVIALAATHGLEDVFDPNYNVPVIGDPDFQLFQNKNRFVYSVWIARISLGMALSILSDFDVAMDGRGVYFKLMDIYECASNRKQVALMSMTKLSALTLTYNSTGGVPVFITKFRTILHDLKSAKEPISDVMAKSMFLSKIQDRDYIHIVDGLLGSNDTLEQVMQRILDKHNMLMMNKPKPNNNRQANSAEGKKKGNKNTRNKGNLNNKEEKKEPNRQNNNTHTKRRITFDMIKETPYFLEKEEFAKLSKEQQDALYVKIHRFFDSKDGKKDSKVKFKGSETRHIKNASVNEETEDDEESDVEEHTGPRINSIMSQNRNNNVVRVCVSRNHESTALIDSGADTCMMGKDFLITSRSDRRVTVEGFGGNDTVICDMEICSGVTLVQPPNQDPILLRVNHGISIQDKSILSCNQMRAYGTIVDETPCHFGGRQSLWLHDGTFLATPVQVCTMLPTYQATYSR